MLLDSPMRQFMPFIRCSMLRDVAFRDRDAKQRWANSIASSGWNMGMGGIGGQILSGAMKNSVGRLFG